MDTPRGIRNSNPGNIRWGDAWQGLVSQDQRTDPSFCQFSAPTFGIRAMVKILYKYQDAYKLTSVRQIISRWAPPNENDTESYIRSVASNVGVDTNDTVSVHNPDVMLKLIQAIIRHENGQQPYSDETIRAGISMA